MLRHASVTYGGDMSVNDPEDVDSATPGGRQPDREMGTSPTAKMAHEVASETGISPWKVWTTIGAALVAAIASIFTGVLTFAVQREQNEIARDLGEREAALEEELGRREAALEDLEIRDQVRLRNLERKERLIEQYLPLILDKDPDKRGQGIAALLSLMNEEEWQAVGRAIEQVDPSVEDELPDFFIDQEAIAAIDWGVTLGGYDDPDEAQDVAERARQADFSPIRMYQQGGQTFVAIAPIDTETEAEIQLRLAARRLPNTGAIVRLDDWCPSPRETDEADVFVCVAQVPDLFDASEQEALMALTDLGFSTLVKRVCSPAVQRGRVFAVVTGVTSERRPEGDSAGETVETGQTITVFVSSGQCSDSECRALVAQTVEQVRFGAGSDRGASEFTLGPGGVAGFDLEVSERQVLQVSLNPKRQGASQLLCVLDPTGGVVAATTSLQASTPAFQASGVHRILVAELAGTRTDYTATFVVPPLD